MLWRDVRERSRKEGGKVGKTGEKKKGEGDEEREKRRDLEKE